MAEMLTYSPDLTSMTGGRGDYRCRSRATRKCRRTWPQKIVEAASKEGELSKV